mmetsp:Transcript_15477/g.39440  ORF Transcript_15477/g.39440 Transcript_15477/m.39440 type:complete len:1066 (-) Transcript_15477:804-4001(-)
MRKKGTATVCKKIAGMAAAATLLLLCFLASLFTLALCNTEDTATPFAVAVPKSPRSDFVSAGAGAGDVDDGKCLRLVTYTAGYFLTEAYSDYPFFMGFLDVRKATEGSIDATQALDHRSFDTMDDAPMGLIEWAFPNNETLLSLVPETDTKILSNASEEELGEVKVLSNIGSFKFIAHRDKDQSLSAPSVVKLNGETCRELVNPIAPNGNRANLNGTVDPAIVQSTGDDTMDGSEKDPQVMVLYQPDDASIELDHPKLDTKFNVSILNVGQTPLDLSTVSIKYYFRNPGSWFLPFNTFDVTFDKCFELFDPSVPPEQVDCGASFLGAKGTVTSTARGIHQFTDSERESFSTFDQGVQGADYVLEIRFTPKEIDRGVWLSPATHPSTNVSLVAIDAGDNDLGEGEDNDDVIVDRIVSVFQNSNSSSNRTATGGDAGGDFPSGILIEPTLHLDFFMRSVGFFLRMNETGDYSYMSNSADPVPAEDSMGVDVDEEMLRKWVMNPNITIQVNNRTIWGIEPFGHSTEGDLVRSGLVPTTMADFVNKPEDMEMASCEGGGGCLVSKTFCCVMDYSFDTGIYDGDKSRDGSALVDAPATRHIVSKSTKVWVYIVASIGAAALVFSTSAAVWVLRKKKKDSDTGRDTGSTKISEKPLQGSVSVLQSKLEAQSTGSPMSVFGSSNPLFWSKNPLVAMLPESPKFGFPNMMSSSLSLMASSFVSSENFDDSMAELFEIIQPEDVKPVRFVGSGAFGSVYEAILQKPKRTKSGSLARGVSFDDDAAVSSRQRRVAIKLVHIRDLGNQFDQAAEDGLSGDASGEASSLAPASSSHSSHELEAFKREVDVLSRVKHPNIVKLHGACMCPPNNVFIVMELMKCSLRDKLDRTGKMSYPDILQLGNQIASALAYLHPTIVHRDLKPQNILIDSDGSAKVCDFGISRFKQSTYLHTTRGNGTPAYMSPECFGSEKISEKADVFSLGMILWECWTGETPWKEVTIPFQVVMLVGVEKRRPELPENCPKQLASLIQKCWDDDPHRRPSCAEVERRTRLLMHEYNLQAEVESSSGARHIGPPQ